MIRALLFDLDNTLFMPASMPRDVLRPCIAALLAANARSRAAEPVVLDRVIVECVRRPFDLIAAEFQLPEELCRAWNEAMGELRLPSELEACEDLHVLRELTVWKCLVTTGYRRVQEQKIDALQLRPLFDLVVIDAIDDTSREGKELIFRRLLREHRFALDEVAVIGDSGESELRIGRALGVLTIQVMRNGVERFEEADQHIADLHGLQVVLERADANASFADEQRKGA